MKPLWSLLGTLLLIALVACGDDDLWVPPPTAASSNAPAGSASAATSAAASAQPEYEVQFSESDFVENDESRDPFRSFVDLFLEQAKQRTVVQRKVLASTHALDELKLSGIVSRGERRALVTDPNGLGWILRTGDYVGKAELVSTGGPAGVDVALNWRVDRIRETDVVFLREDPAHPEIAPTTKVMYLHPLGSKESEYGG